MWYRRPLNYFKFNDSIRNEKVLGGQWRALIRKRAKFLGSIMRPPGLVISVKEDRVTEITVYRSDN